MIEKEYRFKKSETKLIERILEDDNAGINHIVLAKGDFLPEHYSNSNVYLIITGGVLSIKLEEEGERRYQAGCIITIPYKTKMKIRNNDDKVLEFFVVKAPGPGKMREQVLN